MLEFPLLQFRGIFSGILAEFRICLLKKGIFCADSLVIPNCPFFSFLQGRSNMYHQSPYGYMPVGAGGGLPVGAGVPVGAGQAMPVGAGWQGVGTPVGAVGILPVAAGAGFAQGGPGGEARRIRELQIELERARMVCPLPGVPPSPPPSVPKLLDAAEKSSSPSSCALPLVACNSPLQKKAPQVLKANSPPHAFSPGPPRPGPPLSGVPRKW